MRQNGRANVLTSLANIAYGTDNIGDDVQALAALQYAPRDVSFVNRDALPRWRPEPGTKLIMNGCYHEDALPVTAAVDPLLISFHAIGRRLHRPEALEFLRSKSRDRPIGARDQYSLSLLREAGIDAYWSGCLTLTLALQNPPSRGDRILAVDIHRDLVDTIRQSTKRPVETRTHFLLPPRPKPLPSLRHLIPRSRRFALARQRLLDYASAAAVVTSRLHVALPCLAFGTPVLLVTNNHQNHRLASFVPFLHTCSEDDFFDGLHVFSFDAPPPNGDEWRPLAAALEAACSAFTGQQKVPLH
jgi:hypothetical protein